MATPPTIARALGALLALLAACQPVPEASEYREQVRPDAVSALADIGAVALPGVLTGTWAMATDWSTCVTVGKVFETRTRKLLRVEMSRQGHRVLEKREVCATWITPVLGLGTTLGPGVIGGIGALDVQSLMLAEGVGQSYVGGPEVQLYGLKMADPLLEPMPGKGDVDDPRIWDSDGDGHIGATLKVGPSCEVRVVQRAISSVSGTIDASGRITGQGVHFSEQVVLEATSALCAQAYQTAPNDAHNRFVMLRVDKGGVGLDASGDGEVSCAEIVAGMGGYVSWLDVDDTRCAAGKK